MKLEAPESVNYSASVLRIPAMLELPGLDNLRGVPCLGHQALVSRDHQVGELMIALTAETALSQEMAYHNDLHRDATLNKTEATGLLEKNRRVRAVKLRGHRSDALLLPVSSIAWTGVNPAELKEGDCFDTLNGHLVCEKYVVPTKKGSQAQQKKLEKIWRRVDDKMLPEHVQTSQYHRERHLIPDDAELIVTAKSHGSSVRISNTIVKVKPTWKERLARKLGVRVVDQSYDYIHGSRKVIKDPANEKSAHYYGFDLWGREGEKLRGLLPQGTIVYGELLGWAEKGKPIQKSYDYGIPDGECRLQVYRVARISPDGFLTDLGWDQVRKFCQERGLETVVELWRGPHSEFNPDEWIERRFYDEGYTDCLPLPGKKLVDEGVVIRVEGDMVPGFWKIKSPTFLRLESSQIDEGVADLESIA
jgi:hypothetical protein